jgi:8-amino-7-oxononanoate synthase
MSYLQRVADALDELDAAGLRRTIRETHDDCIDFSSNDYLGLARHESVVAALRAASRAGSGGARLLAGAHSEHLALESALAELVRREDALLFSSGYLAAIGAIGTFARFAREAYSDERNHACLIDGLRLTKMPRTIYAHLAAPAARGDGALLVTETLFGMDGDALDVETLAATLAASDVALLDEAHAVGIAGPHGGGLAAAVDDQRIIVIGTLSKALAASGGFVAGPRTAIELLRNAARTFLFDTALPPAIAAAALAAVRIAAGNEGAERRARLHARAAQLRNGLADLGYPTPGTGPVVPVVIGEPGETLALARVLAERKIRVAAIRPPTVPAGTSRLRLTVRADHAPHEVEMLLSALASALPAVRV